MQWTAAFLAMTLLTTASGAQTVEPLWQIGQQDRLTEELAHGPDGVAELPDGAVYVAGWSKAEEDWPYAQAGPADVWAGGRPHTYSVVFTLAAAPEAGECALEVALASTHYQLPPVLEVALNGSVQAHATLPAQSDDAPIHGHPERGTPHVFRLAWPASALCTGENELRITTVAGSWLLYDWLRFSAPPGARLDATACPAPRVEAVRTPPVLVASANGLAQPVYLRVRAFGASAGLEVSVGDVRQPVDLAAGTQELRLDAPVVAASATLPVTLAHEGAALWEGTVTLEPVRRWTVYLLHHTHLDIGYTHHQDAVEQLQWQHLDKALSLAEATRDYPEEARFTWLPEGLWAVDSYLARATEEQRGAFYEAVRRGDIGLDMLYGNELTALCRPEELLELTARGRRLAREHGLTIDSAMITDVPGYTWGTVTALAKSGVRYFSIGPNRGHRIGHTLTAWGDRPFYWVSPSGEDRVLTWVHGEGYSWFHGGVSAAPAFRRQYEMKLLGYLDRLQDREDYPWDLAVLRYNIGGDNGPPDEHLSDFIREWNQRYAFPRLVMATTTEALGAFEAKYGDTLPEVRGDFTPYWEDGAGSSARETALVRGAAERLVQAATLGAMTAAPHVAEDYARAWREVLLYDEHTWGAHNSISEPHSQFALDQWATKQAFATEADAQSRALLDAALAPLAATGTPVRHVSLFNTESWARTELVVLPAAWERAGDRVLLDGEELPAQVLADGSLAFVARKVPPLGGVCVELKEGAPAARGSAQADGNTLTNGPVWARVDPQTGAIVELGRGNGHNLAGDDGFGGLNAYRYVDGRAPGAPQANGAVTVEVVEPGPVVATLRITSSAPGCASLVRELRVVDGLPEVFITDTLDKEAVYTPEAVHIAFPFDVPGGTVRLDTPYAVVRPDADQLDGACRNYFTVQRWVDVSNDAVGVTWVTLDAPLVEVGGITNDARSVGWLEELPPTTTILSYVMNNYWETNYKASQDGPTVFRYALRPHGPYDPVAAHRSGIANSRPIVTAPVAKPFARVTGLVVRDPYVMVQALRVLEDGERFLLRLHNAGDAPVGVLRACPALARGETVVADLDGAPMGPLAEDASLAPGDIITLACGPGIFGS